MRVPTKATGDYRGMSYVNIADHAGSRVLDHPANKPLGCVDLAVEALTLDALLDRIEVTAVDLLKVDTEGHELNIFRAYSWRVRPAVIKAEHIHSPGDALQKLLEARGYYTWNEPRDLYAIDAAPPILEGENAARPESPPVMSGLWTRSPLDRAAPTDQSIGRSSTALDGGV